MVLQTVQGDVKDDQQKGDDKNEQIRLLQEANELLQEQLVHAQASITTLTGANDLLSDDGKQNFKLVY